MIELETEPRPAAAAAAGGATANDSMIVAVNWLSRVYVHLNHFCQLTGGETSLQHLSPSYFIDSLPLDSTHHFKTWFMDLWNQKLVRQVVHPKALKPSQK